MRPINLIPVDQRRGQHAPLRTGPLAYLLVGLLVVALGGVAMLVVTDNQIAESRAEVTELKHEDRVVTRKTERLAAYTQFKQLSEQRVATVESLANSRFDWERVMRELSLVLPADVWLSKLEATASPSVATGGGGGESEGSSSGSASVRSQAPGPALELIGCAHGQVGVAGFAAALKDIDGVTRVAVESSALPAAGEAAGTGSAGEAGGSSTECRTRRFISQFEIVVAFDAAPVPPTATEAGAPVAVSEPEAAESSGEEAAPEGGE
jgi:Tfp pilus assembly protein PilN